MSPDVKGDRLHDLFLPGCFSIFAERAGLQHNMTISLYFSSPMLGVSEGTRCSDTVKLKSLVPSSCVVMFGPLHAATALVWRPTSFDDSVCPLSFLTALALGILHLGSWDPSRWGRGEGGSAPSLAAPHCLETKLVPQVVCEEDQAVPLEALPLLAAVPGCRDRIGSSSGDRSSVRWNSRPSKAIHVLWTSTRPLRAPSPEQEIESLAFAQCSRATPAVVPRGMKPEPSTGEVAKSNHAARPSIETISVHPVLRIHIDLI